MVCARRRWGGSVMRKSGRWHCGCERIDADADRDALASALVYFCHLPSARHRLAAGTLAGAHRPSGTSRGRDDAARGGASASSPAVSRRDDGARSPGVPVGLRRRGACLRRHQRRRRRRRPPRRRRRAGARLHGRFGAPSSLAGLSILPPLVLARRSRGPCLARPGAPPPRAAKVRGPAHPALIRGWRRRAR